MDEKPRPTFRRNLLVKGGDVFMPGHVPEVKKIVILDGKFVHVGPDEPVRGESECRELDASGMLVVPGFIDMHVHGGGGKSVTDATPDAILEIARVHSMFGTTALVPTIISSPPEKMHATLLAIRGAAGSEGGEAILGAHLEGPWLNPEKAGAHRVEHIKRPDIGFAKELVSEYGDVIRMVTIAPELPGALEIIELLADNNIVVSIGHTAATYDKTMAGFAAGASGVTHIFNAMAQLHHRNPGPLGATFDNAHATVELIADGHHVSPWTIAFLIKIHGSWNVALVTDSLSPTGTARKLFQVGETTFIEIRDGGAFTEDGQVYGSVLTMAAAVRNIRSFTELQLEDVIPMATSIPAVHLKRDETLGGISEGRLGNLVLFDRKLEVYATVIQGKLVYRRLDNA